MHSNQWRRNGEQEEEEVVEEEEKEKKEKDRGSKEGKFRRTSDLFFSPPADANHITTKLFER